MRNGKHLTIVLTTLWFLACSVPSFAADIVADGTVVDSTNWGDIEGFAVKAFAENKGMYDLDEEHGMVDARTGKAAESIVGIPFPAIDPADPKAAAKIMYNNHYMQYVLGDIRVEIHLRWFKRSGFEREGGCEWIQAAMDGWQGAPWAATNLAWAKRPMYLVEAIPLDPNYNYGCGRSRQSRLYHRRPWGEEHLGGNDQTGLERLFPGRVSEAV